MSSDGHLARPARIALLAIGTRGDVQPFVALGIGLRDAGFDVVVATHASHAEMVRRAGLAMHVVAGDPRRAVADRSAPPGRGHQDGRVAFSRTVHAMSSEVMAERLRDCWEAARGADAIVAAPLAILAGHHIAEKLQIPLVRVFLMPMSPTGAYPALGLPARHLGARVNRWTHQVEYQALWLLFRAQANAARRAVLDLPPLSLRNPLTRLDRAHALVLDAYSPAFWPPPPDWGAWNEVTGFWFLDRPPDWQPPAELVRFLAAGPPPIYVGFGSMVTQAPDELTRLVVEAVTRAGQRALLGRGWGGLTPLPATEHLLCIDDVPHDWLFPQVAAVVHHGGIGTTGLALRAGVPSVILPFLPDQRQAGQRICELGLGPPSLERNEITVERLAAAIRTAASDQVLTQRVRAISTRIQREDGVGRAVAAIQAYLGAAASPPKLSV